MASHQFLAAVFSAGSSGTATVTQTHMQMAARHSASHCCEDLLHHCGVEKPILKTDCPDLRIAASCEGLVVNFCSEVGFLRIRHDLSHIVFHLQDSACEFV